MEYQRIMGKIKAVETMPLSGFFYPFKGVFLSKTPFF